MVEKPSQCWPRTRTSRHECSDRRRHCHLQEESRGGAPQGREWDPSPRSQSPYWRLWGQECGAEGGEEGREKSITRGNTQERCGPNHPPALGICA